MATGKLKCVIVDDDRQAHLILQAHLTVFPNLVLAGSAFTGRQAYQLLHTENCDILFLDMEMPDLSGIELLEVLPRKPAVIVVSAHKKYAFDAFQMNVTDYLQKPVLLDRFSASINKALAYLDFCRQKAPLFEIELKSNRQRLKFPVNEIVLFQSIGNYVKVFTTSTKHPVICYSSLRELNEILSGSGFIQVHKSYLVRKSAIVEKSHSSIVVSNGEQIPIGSKYTYLLQYFLK